MKNGDGEREKKTGRRLMGGRATHGVGTTFDWSIPPDKGNAAGSCSLSAPQAYRGIQVKTRDRGHFVCSGEAAGCVE